MKSRLRNGLREIPQFHPPMKQPKPMKAPSPTITVEEWLTAWDEVAGRKADAVPAGWFTIEQIAASMGRKETVARIRIKAMLNAGKAEVRTFRLRFAAGLRRIPHYRLKK